MATTLPPGLCETCQHSKRTETKRGSVFYRCLLAQTNPLFAKYPPLPVVHCDGYQPTAPAPAITKRKR
jgi:hypothetical protein